LKKASDLRIYLSHIGGKLDSAYYRELLAVPPINYINRSSYQDTAVLIKGSKFSGFNKFARFSQRVSGLPSMQYIYQKCEVIHAAHHLVLNRTPWVVDFEHIRSPAGFWSYNSLFARSIVPRLLNSKWCKRILPWSYVAKKTAETYCKNYWPKLKHKTEVMYPTARLQKINKKRTDTINLLHVSRFFYSKGGVEALHAFDILTKKYDNVEATLISNIPTEINKKYADNPKINLINKVSREVLNNKFWPQTDIFVYPSRGDTFGLAILESMAFGIPNVVSDEFALPEIVSNGKNGFVVKSYIKKWYDQKTYYDEKGKWREITKKERSKVVDKFVEKISLLIEDRQMRRRFGKNAYKEVEKGKFCAQKRNKRLIEIYEEAASK